MNIYAPAETVVSILAKRPQQWFPKPACQTTALLRAVTLCHPFTNDMFSKSFLHQLSYSLSVCIIRSTLDKQQWREVVVA